jgi:hypothetical protein
MDLVDVGVAARREGAQEVQRRRGLEIGLEHPVGVRDPRLGGEVEAVDDVALVGWQLLAVDRLGGGRTWLGELAGHAAHLHNGHLGAVGEHHRHLQDHLEGVADVVGRELGEAFGAVAALEEEGLALATPCQRWP